MNILLSYCRNTWIKPIISTLKYNIYTFNYRNIMKSEPIKKPTILLHKLNITRSFANHRHKKVLKLAKGYRGRAKSCFTVAIQRVQKARQYAYRDRKV